LTPEQQAIWDQLPNEAKEVILATNKSQNTSDNRKANLHDMSAQDYLELQLKVNLMDISADELVVNLHDTAGASVDTNLQFFDATEGDDSTSPSNGSDNLGSRKAMSTMIAPSRTAMKTMTAPQKNVTPPKGPVKSIQQVLSTALRKKPTPVKSGKPPPKHDPDKEIVIGDKRYVLHDEQPVKHNANTIQWQVMMCERTSDNAESTSDGMPPIGIN